MLAALVVALVGTFLMTKAQVATAFAVFTGVVVLIDPTATLRNVFIIPLISARLLFRFGGTVV